MSVIKITYKGLVFNINQITGSGSMLQRDGHASERGYFRVKLRYVRRRKEGCRLPACGRHAQTLG